MRRKISRSLLHVPDDWNSWNSKQIIAWLGEWYYYRVSFKPRRFNYAAMQLKSIRENTTFIEWSNAELNLPFNGPFWFNRFAFFNRRTDYGILISTSLKLKFYSLIFFMQSSGAINFFCRNWIIRSRKVRDKV